MTNRELLCDMDYEDLTVFANPDYDAAIIGVSNDYRVIYDYDYGFGAFNERTTAPQAEWIICSDGYYPYCSRCGEEPVERKMTDFCSHCGASMKKRS